jgi:uncharacterized protein (DUF849 family)
MDSTIIKLKACLNGGRRSDEYPAVPVTSAELAAAVTGAVAAAAGAVWTSAASPR